MFKRIPGSQEYLINLKKEIINYRGESVEFDVDHEEMVEIELFGRLHRVNLQWLALLAWYECGTIQNLEQHLGKIKFYPANWFLRIRCGYVMKFTQPVEHMDGYMYIPCYPRYAINLQGEVLDTAANSILGTFTGHNGYIFVYMRSPDLRSTKNVQQHRLMALAWLPNDDFMNKPIINHLDGVKSNNALTNLEWCCQADNVDHAVETQLIDCSVVMKSRDVVTGEIQAYRSVAELSRKLGLSRGWSGQTYAERLPGHLYNSRYEVKRADDLSPWYYEGTDPEDIKYAKSLYAITVFDKETGEQKLYTNSRDFFTAYKLWGALNVEHGVKLFKEKFPEKEISYKRNAVAGPYQVLNLESNTVNIVKNVIDACDYVGLGRNELSHDLRRGKKFIYGKKWIVKAGLDKINLVEYVDKPAPFYKVLVVDLESGKESMTDSIKAAARFTGVCEQTIKRKIETGKSIRGYCFRPLK